MNNQQNIHYKDLLPIGSVVKLKDVEKFVLIFGRFQIQASSQRIYDYVRVPYPEGNITSDYNVFFNRNMIQSVEHFGMKSIVEDKMRKKIEKEIQKAREEETQQ